MGKNIEVSLEVFGNKRISSVMKPEEVSGRSIQSLIDHVVNQDWSGEDARNVAIIKKEMKSSGGYTPAVGLGGRNTPVRFEPVRLGDPIQKYVQPTDLPNDLVRVAVLGRHTVGYL